MGAPHSLFSTLACLFVVSLLHYCYSARRRLWWFFVCRFNNASVPLCGNPNSITSSRRHAMIFHHSNGSCYVVDCGSSHGTYINGIRVISTPNEGNVVVPTRLRRGSMVRFGGPGAPSFVLKAFSFDLEEMRDFSVPTISLRPTRQPSSP